MVLGGLEGGGTKMVCAIGDEFGNITDQISIPTEAPSVTMPKIIEYFLKFPIVALGVATFGPIELDKSSKKYGYVTSTTKMEWRDFDILGCLKQALNVPCGFDTDVNGSCLGEITYGCMRGLNNGMYITVGTGIGIGIYCNGGLVHGMLHPEAGHMGIIRHPEDTFPGVCIFHHDCLEGLASGPALQKRAGMPAAQIPEGAKDWEFESYYLAQGLKNLILTMAPEKIVLGGGVMHRTHLFPMIREDVRRLLNGYIVTDEIADLDRYIVPASLHDDQGIMGCMKLAYDAACNS